MNKVNVLNFYGPWNEERSSKFLRAAMIIELAMDSREFADKFLSKKFTQLPKEFAGKSNEELYSIVMSTSPFNYHLKRKSFFKRFTSAIGWTQDDHSTQGLDIHTYVDRYDDMSVKDLAGHIAHEMTHLKGMSHSFKWTSERDNSVPYVVGDIVREIADLFA